MKINKYIVASYLSFPLNISVLLVVRHFFNFEVAVLVGIAAIVATIDEFGYLGFGGCFKSKGGKKL
jgi:hypothetical protein